MDKMEKIENARNLQVNVAKDLNLERFLVPQDPTTGALVSNARAWLFDQLKAEVSSRLATIEAIFVASNVMEDVEVLKAISLFLSDFSSECQAFIDQYAEFDDDDDQEGGVENA